MKTIGETIDTSITLKAVCGGDQRAVSLGQLLERPTVISIYMRNNTSSCDLQNDSLVAAADAIHAAGFDIIAVSRDSCKSHASYAAKKNIRYTLVSDPDDLVARAFDAIVEKSMYGKKYLGPARAAFLVDSNGRILGVIEKVESKQHGDQVLAVIKAITQ